MKIKSFIQLFLIFIISFYFVSKYTGQVSLEYKINIIENKKGWKGEVFYSDNDSFSSSKRKSIRYKPLINQPQAVKINLGNQPDIKSIRSDPLTDVGMIKISNINVKYKNQIHIIDIAKIGLKNYKHNIKILEQNNQHIILECLGQDPHIILTNSLNLSNVNLQDIVISIILAILIYIFLTLIKSISVQNYVLSSLIILYSLYALLFLSPNLASTLLTTFAILSLIVAIKNNILDRIPYIKNIGIFLLVYMLMSYLSLYVTTEHANLEYLNAKIPYVILATLIPIGFYNINNFNMNFFKIMLTVILSLVASFIILLDHNILLINDIQFFDYVMHRSPWTQKNYIFWYVLLMFGTLSFYNVKQKFDLFIVLGIVILSFFIVFNGYSNSARLSFSAGLIFYFILSVFTLNKKYLLIFIWFLTLYIVFSPIVFALLDVFSYITALHGRTNLYNTSLAFIKEHWIFGYGYGSTLTIHLKDFVSTSDLPRHYTNVFYGGHPHNLSLLFWLEFGVFGALFLAYFIHELLKKFIEKTFLYINHAALFGMIVAFDIITSFSWSIWYPQVLLTFAFFGTLLTLSMNIIVKNPTQKSTYNTLNN